MYKIKRHLLLNIYYLHDQYSGPVTDEYEVVDEAEYIAEAYSKLESYKRNSTPAAGGLFDDHYKFHHMKDTWGEPDNAQPYIGQLFYVCVREHFDKWRTLYQLCEVKDIQEPRIFLKNHGEKPRRETMTIAQFQSMAMFPGREESFIRDWEMRIKCKYPRNLISKLKNIRDYRGVTLKQISLSKGTNDWDIEFVDFNHITGA